MENDHETIIPKDIFIQVQAELVRRVVHTSPSGKRRNFSSNNCFSHIVYCGECGDLYRRIHWNNHGCKSIVWRCITRLEPSSADTTCTNRTVKEELLKEISVKAINAILLDSNSFIRQIQENLAEALTQSDTPSPAVIQRRLEELQQELIAKTNRRQAYDAIANEIFRLREQKEKAEANLRGQKEGLDRIKDLHGFVKKQSSNLTEFDESLVQKLLKSIQVFPDHFSIKFKSGINIDINE